MIEVSMSSLVVIPLVFNLMIILTCYVYYATLRVARHAVRRRTRIYRCDVCEHVYGDDRDVPLARCPRCGCLNEAVRR